MISYAENHEDVLLERCFKEQETGFYVDIGAWEPVLHSVTQHFYAKGWRGINVEPSPEPFTHLIDARPRDINLQVALAGDVREMTLTVVHESGLSTLRTLDTELLDNLGTGGFESEEVSVTTQTLARVCSDHVPPGTDIDFMKIDVEGLEAEVLRGGDWQSFRPKVLVVEVVTPIGFDPATRRVSVEDLSPEWEPELLQHGYAFATSDGLNRYFVRHEDESLVLCFATPVNSLDDYMPYSMQLAQVEAAAEAARASDLEHRLTSAEERIATLETQITDAHEQLRAVHASTSWRLTAPVRWVGGWVRRRNGSTE